MSEFNITMTSYGTGHQKICDAVGQLTLKDFEKSIDQGGHGGAIRIKEAIQGKYLFLKPKAKDGTEARNYQIIGTTNKNMAKWMPMVYGEVKINNRTFLVMENIRKAGSGLELPQLADIKLAGKVDGLSKPIANSKEMQITRNQKKSLSTKLWMRFVTAIAPEYLITNGGFRLFDYFKSKKILKDSLNDVSTMHLNRLLADLIRMKDDIKKSGIAFIGASIALIHQEDGSVKAVLIDPAHIQCSNDLNTDIVKVLGEEESKKVFYECETSGGKNQYLLQKTSNIVALDAIIQTIQSIQTARAAKLQPALLR
jgi:hypothetical protein